MPTLLTLRLAMSQNTRHTHHIRLRDEQIELASKRAAPSADVEGRLQQAKSELEELQARREELERLKQETERLDFRRRELVVSQVEVTERLNTTLTMIEREVYELRQELEDLEQCRLCFNAHLTKIGKINPDGWPREGLGDLIDRAAGIIEAAEDEYAQAAEHFSRTRSAAVFSAARSKGGYRGEFFRQFMRGLAFNLPLAITVIIALVLLLKR